MMRRRSLLALSFALLLASSGLNRAGAAGISSSWPQFRGPNSYGVAPAAKTHVKIDPINGALWKIDVPWSLSSPCVWEDWIFLTTSAEGQLQTRCYDRKQGQAVWKNG